MKTVGILFYFKDRAEPISFGKEGTNFNAAVFNESQRIKTIKLTDNFEDDTNGDFRWYEFYDTTGKELAIWKHTDGKEMFSIV